MSLFAFASISKSVVRKISSTVAVALLAAALLVPSAGQAAKEPVAHFIDRTARELVAANNNPDERVIADLIRRHADIEGIGQYSLGSHFDWMPNADKAAYFDGLVRLIARYAVEQSQHYKVTGFEVGRPRYRGQEVMVDTRVRLANGSSYKVRWKLTRVDGEYKVRDAKVLIFWLTPALRKLFLSYIRDNRGDVRALLAALGR